MWVFPEVSLRCPQLYCEHYLTDEDSAPEKDDRTAGTAVGELGFKGKAEETQGSFFCPFWPFPSSPLSHRCFCGQRKHSISCVSVSSGFVGVSGSGLGLVFTTCCWTDPWEVSTTLTKLLHEEPGTRQGRWSQLSQSFSEFTAFLASVMPPQSGCFVYIPLSFSVNRTP